MLVNCYIGKHEDPVKSACEALCRLKTEGDEAKGVSVYKSQIFCRSACVHKASTLQGMLVEEAVCYLCFFLSSVHQTKCL